ncbi:hypothetical protein M8A51_08550 [Schlegelella sp. S2-27]|uniref:Uncharacterized protein n=1 Tax=Caldimonas mangrovi TaxID=2944811 RepID=A0ABT0YLG9_9BURK|nr:hypothetical protein [Caldimonas mangrovi]MCM5679580.1 hypothetical protein [Caldimonas mangrovi]
MAPSFDGEGQLIGAINAWAAWQPKPQQPQPQERAARLASYSTAFALTQNTFRSANNVATLAAKADKWFISFYETRRQAVLKEAHKRGTALLKATVLPALGNSSNVAFREGRKVPQGDEHNPQYAARSTRRLAVQPVTRSKASRPTVPCTTRSRRGTRGTRTPTSTSTRRRSPTTSVVEHKGQHGLEFHWRSRLREWTYGVAGLSRHTPAWIGERLSVRHHHGTHAAGEAYREVLHGVVPPGTGYVGSLWQT